MNTVAVLIVAWNPLRLGHAADLVASLKAIDFLCGQWRVFLGDNASDDGSPDYFDSHLPAGSVVRFGENLGFAEANNRLAQKALDVGFTHAYLLNQDCTVDPQVLRKALDIQADDPTIGSVQSRVLMHHEPDTLNTIGNAIHYLGFGFSLGSYQKASLFPREQWDRRDIAYASGAGMLFRLDLLPRIGLFCPDFFMYHEDLDFGWQIRLLGLRNVASYDSVVYHKYEFSKSSQKYYYLERNRFLVLLENYRLPTLLLILPGLLIFEMGLLAFAWKSGFLREKLRVYGYFWKWSNWRALLARRACKQRRRVTSDRRILQTMTGSISNMNIDNWILNRLANPCFRAFFAILKWIVFW